MLDEEEVTGFRIDKNEKPLITEFKGYSKVLKVFKKYDKQDLLEDKTDCRSTLLIYVQKLKELMKEKILLKQCILNSLMI